MLMIENMILTKQSNSTLCSAEAHSSTIEEVINPTRSDDARRQMISLAIAERMNRISTTRRNMKKSGSMNLRKLRRLYKRTRDKIHLQYKKQANTDHMVCTISHPSELPTNCPGKLFGSDSQIARQRQICLEHITVFSRELRLEAAAIDPMKIELRPDHLDVWDSRDNKRPPRIQSHKEK
jgi:hypothetical protein